MRKKVASGTVGDILARWRKYFLNLNNTGAYSDEEPIRSELYGAGQLNNHAKTIAARHKLLDHKVPDQLLKRLEDNERKLLEVRNLLVENIQTGKVIMPAGEWLLDNFYIIEEQIVLARKHLPKGYSEELPHLANGVSAGRPRVYDIVLEIIAHSDGRVDMATLSSYIAAYQTGVTLTLGELWAIPIMLRLSVIENLRRVSSKIALDMIDHNLADYWTNKMKDAVAEDPGSLILVMADMVRSKPVLGSPFVAGFLHKLQGQGRALALPLSWIQDQLTAMDISSNDLISQENQKQAADQVSVRNSIGTLRFLGANDWSEFVETLSNVEQILRKDITGIYPLMDFATRDQYRHAVEHIARCSPLSETEVAEQALLFAARAQEAEPDGKRAHVGYYLIDKGLPQTEQAARMRISIRKAIARMAAKMPVSLYLSLIALLTAALAWSMCYMAFSKGVHNRLLSALIMVLSVSGAAQLAVSLVNWLSTILIKPKLLPRMDFSKSIPAECRTLVVIPTLLSNKAYLDELIEGLEIRFLANQEGNLHYGLLTDFPDAPAETLPDDAYLEAQAKISIDALNEKYAPAQQDIFFLFHRPRTWNAKERKWMGYERKRGKLAALNALLKRQEQQAFSLLCGNMDILNGVKYVITLDSDTQLPRETAWKLIATMAHPLNHAHYDNRKMRVTEGYGILQPRVASAIPQSATSLYWRMQGSAAGIDPYTNVSSDVYQDLFGEGSFIGKGIYDVDIFEQAVHNVLQENRILSHDLIEGCYARSGLLSNILLYEENPTRYTTDIKRNHRWIRGDWQIGAWMLPFITAGNGKLTINKLSLLSRWKLLDNLRRSLVPVSLLLLLLLGWTLLPYPFFWTLAVTLILLFPVIADAVWQLLHKPVNLKIGAHLSEVARSLSTTFIRFLFSLAVLPYEALQYTDAIIRTNWRMVISRRRLLEWTPSAAIPRPVRNDLGDAYRNMWFSPFLAIASFAIILFLHPVALIAAMPVLILWLLAPALTWRTSQPEKDADPGLTAAQYVFLHKTARKTWYFFEKFVTAEEQWLPPDNYQKEPVTVIAHRTSPTNIGLALLANLTAYDFGYISGEQLLQRSSDTLESVSKLERYKGHFYNWYDTLSLLPLLPRYVSTVDSGNLIGHILTLKQGLIALPKQQVFKAIVFEGILTTARIVQDHLSRSRKKEMAEILDALQNAAEGQSSLNTIKNQLDQLMPWIAALAALHSETSDDVGDWISLLALQVTNIRKELLKTVPWMDLLPVPEKFSSLFPLNEIIPSIASIERTSATTLNKVAEYEKTDNDPAETEWLGQLKSALIKGRDHARENRILIERLAEQCEQFSTVSYDFLLDRPTGLLRIGYNVTEQRKDDSYYDLLASEARLCVFVGIAQGKLSQESWFSLGRLLTNSGGNPVLLSWSGSMFEYLMPQLVMPLYENTLLQQTSRATVKKQIEYARKRDVPWGISESAYHAFDAALNYQYRAFGVPGLGLKRGLEEDLVIAPYASMMALMVMPARACANLQLLSGEGLEGEYGFYEAVDYTPSRLPVGKKNAIVKSFMIHHQGMGLLSLSYLLLGKPMQQRFVAELRFQATLLLLQERIPRATLFYAHTAELIQRNAAIMAPVRKINGVRNPVPEIKLLSNGRYHVMLTDSGGGYSRWKDIALTRWREDSIADSYGIFCYIKDTGNGSFWSNTYQPAGVDPQNYEVIYSQGHAAYLRNDNGLETKTEIVISPEDDTELRRVRITNNTQSAKVLEVTSYAEVVMAAQATDEDHPAFSNLFVQTEILPHYKAVLATRRPRSQEEVPPWMFHLVDVRGVAVETVSYETDRMRFVGRGSTLANPAAMYTDQLSGSQGAVLDPVLSVRYRFSLMPNQTAVIDMIYGISDNRENCIHMLHKYQDLHLKNRAFELSWTHSQVLLHQINATEVNAQLYDRLAGAVVFNHPAMRADPAVINGNSRGQSGLWSHSVSGDLPIVLLHIYNPESIELVTQMIQAHAYWRLKGLAADLVIWNEDYGSYRQLLQDQILGLITAETGSQVVYSKPGSIFVKSADQLSAEDRILFESVARVIISDDKGTLAEQISQKEADKALPVTLNGTPAGAGETTSGLTLPEGLLFANGTGGFTPDGKTYKIITDDHIVSPAPWVNIIANPGFGTVISESGSAYTWVLNAHEYRLTPWSNDPVSDTGGEAFYLRDEETARFWSLAPFPAKGRTAYITTHGFGYSTFEHEENGLFTGMSVFADKEEPIKFIVLKIKNHSDRDRRLSVSGYMEMILGNVRSKTNMHILSEQDKASGALLFRNRYNTAFAERVSFFKVNDSNSFTTDRTEFIGRNKSLRDPAALYREKLSGRVGAGKDTCAALQVKFDLPAGAEKEIIFQVGSGENRNAAEELIRRFKEPEAVAASLKTVKEYWKEMTGAIQVSTPDKALDILTNGWLLYQTIACRLFARTGLYQSGGAFGFRDQLQDVLALLQVKSALVKDQLLLHASRQFTEGDVQHWWHPPEGRGVRTRCSDDLLWLPFVAVKYIKATGDKSILDKKAGFLESRPLHDGEDSLYDLPVSGNLVGTLYEHCVRSIKQSLRMGEHGLPLIGSGDWNDGMDQVGPKGRGESVWLAFFLYSVLTGFEEVATAYGDTSFATLCSTEAAKLQSNIEKSAWDGDWYLRAWFDNGSALGSHSNEEGKIDAIAQSWSVLSGAGDKERRKKAMASLDKYLVKRDMRLIQLLDPAFDRSALNPGYIKGYVPGVRENGGQYSHAAVWTLMAFAGLGEREKVYELFSMIQPISHSDNAAATVVYKVEPYVMAADVYANESHKGRGGWTWYTGSAGWMYQFILESLLGLQLRDGQLFLKPCFPLNWPSVKIRYRYGAAVYFITIIQEERTGESWWKAGEEQVTGNRITLTDDGEIHEVTINISTL